MTGKRVVEDGGHESCGLPPKHLKVDVLRRSRRGQGAPSISGRRSEEGVVEDDGHECCGLPPKHLKVDALRRRHGAQAPSISERRSEGVASSSRVTTTTPNMENQAAAAAADAVSNDDLIPSDNHRSIVSRNKVMETLKLFNELFEKLSHEHDEPKSKGKMKAGDLLKAAMALKKEQKWVNDTNILGAVGGAEVGDQFGSRAELVIIGLHQHFVAGIAYMKKDKKPLATSIVSSGRYGNHTKSCDVLIYSGEGGNQLGVNKKFKPEDQKLKRGNLALKNSMEARTPVRVIIAQNQNSSSIGKTYVYEGLYLVTNFWEERQKPYRKLAYMFAMKRLTVEEPNKLPLFEESSDIFLGVGVEKRAIQVLNGVDDDEQPLSFNYIKEMKYPELSNQSSPIGCNCIHGCSDLKPCSCTVKNGGEIPFNEEGAILRPIPIVYECGPSCKCPPSCGNRVGQNGIRFELQVFKTESRGWGVRSPNSISSGRFICEYVGELLRDKEADERIGNDDYLFDTGVGGGKGKDKDKDDGYTIDAAHTGNVGRFINHSCSPNLYVQNVLYDHEDDNMCHLMLFASRNIPPLQELTYDYNYKEGQVRDANGNVKMKDCYCGSKNCSKRMY